jgi:hypothetical protein
MLLGLGGAERQEGKQFFFEKKNQKTFDYTRLALRHRAHQYAKVFASFFKKKRFLASGGAVSRPASGLSALDGKAPACPSYRVIPTREKNDSRKRASGGQGPAPGPRQRRALDPIS